MIIGEIIGTVVSTIKVAKIYQSRLKIAKVINPFGEPTGKYFIVEDAVGVGTGEKVLISDDDGVVRKLLGKDNIPIRSAVVAKVDKINIYE
ncbi:MAG: EutN/CcmL family microcompartment protein [Actinobacteria bacterium]|nr:EutN/CcmL family microcompartment protein [Actinomycetota bacterium]MCL6088437.1 EutN/CcmL family microcompartment protein [Actinomycetota bacterium]